MNRADTTKIGPADRIDDDNSEPIIHSLNSNVNEHNRSTLSAVGTSVGDRLTRFPPSVVLLQLFLALGWSRAIAEKVIDPDWWNNNTVRAFIVDANNPIDWYQPFAESVLLPTATVVSALALALQLGVALSMASGRFLSHGLAAGIFLNLNFLAMGEISPSVFYLVLQGVLAFWLAENISPAPRFAVLRGYAALGLGLSVSCIPFIETLHPGEVLDDVGIMMTTGGVLTAVACELTSRRLYGCGVLSLRPRATGPETFE